MLNFKEKSWYTVVGEQGWSNSWDFQWSLPVENEDGIYTPGDWHEFPLQAQTLLIATLDPQAWVQYGYEQTVYELEVAEDATFSEYQHNGQKVVVSKVRLAKPFTGCIKSSVAFTEQWYKDGLIHRDDDLPAIIKQIGDEFWYQNGKLERGNDQPAAVYSNGGMAWYKNGRLHRDNAPAYKNSRNGAEQWYQHGKLHRDQDLPASIGSDGKLEWFQHDRYHREGGGPCIIYPNGDKTWFKEGLSVQNENNGILSSVRRSYTLQ